MNHERFLSAVARIIPTINVERLRARLNVKRPSPAPLTVEQQYLAAVMALEDAENFGTPIDVERAIRELNKARDKRPKRKR